LGALAKNMPSKTHLIPCLLPKKLKCCPV